MANGEQELQNILGNYGSVLRQIPTSELQQLERILANMEVTLGRNTKEFSNFTRGLQTMRKETSLNQQELARMADSLTSSTTRMALRMENLQKVMIATSKIDPFNADRRAQGLMRYSSSLNRIFDQYKSGEHKLKDLTDAHRLLNSMMAQGDFANAATLRALINGDRAAETYTLKIKKLGSAFTDTAIRMAKFAAEIPVLNKAIEFLSTEKGSEVGKLIGTGLAASGGGLLLRRMAGVGGGGGGKPPAPPTPIPKAIPAGAGLAVGASIPKSLAPPIKGGGLSSMFTPGRARGAGIAGLAMGLGSYALAGENQKTGVMTGAMTGAAVGSLVMPGWGTAIGGGLGALYGFFSRKLPDAAKEGTQEITRAFEEMASDARQRVGTTLALYTGSDGKEGQARLLNKSKSAVAGTAAGMGLMGPQIQIDLADQMIQSYKRQLDELQRVKEEFVQEQVKNGSTLAQAQEAAAGEFGSAIMDTYGKILGEIQTTRRSFMEQMIGGAINMPTGTYSMPTDLSERQKYGSSYYDFMPLNNISGRAQQEKYSDRVSKFRPYEQMVVEGLKNGYANGGRIPGSPSGKDNRIAAVASGEYVINAGAVSHYGTELFDALNSRSAPSFSGGGRMGPSSDGTMSGYIPSESAQGWSRVFSTIGKLWVEKVIEPTSRGMQAVSDIGHKAVKTAVEVITGAEVQSLALSDSFSTLHTFGVQMGVEQKNMVDSIMKPIDNVFDSIMQPLTDAYAGVTPEMRTPDYNENPLAEANNSIAEMMLTGIRGGSIYDAKFERPTTTFSGKYGDGYFTERSGDRSAFAGTGLGFKSNEVAAEASRRIKLEQMDTRGQVIKERIAKETAAANMGRLSNMGQGSRGYTTIGSGPKEFYGTGKPDWWALPDYSGHASDYLGFLEQQDSRSIKASVKAASKAEIAQNLARRQVSLGSMGQGTGAFKGMGFSESFIQGGSISGIKREGGSSLGEDTGGGIGSGPAYYGNGPSGRNNDEAKDSTLKEVVQAIHSLGQKMAYGIDQQLTS